MIFAWLAAKSLGLARWTWLLILAAVLAAVVSYFVAAEKSDDKTNQTIGATAEREKTNATVIGNVEKANDAREEIRAPDRAGACARYSVCLRSARNPAQCQRFLPSVEAGNGIGCPGARG